MSRAQASPRSLRRVALGVVVLLVAACTAPPQAPAPTDPRVLAQAHAIHLAWLDGLSDWDARGRLAAKLPEDAVSASMRWRQRDDRYELRLSGPFGQGLMRIDGEPGAVRLRTSDGRTTLAGTPEELVSRELGWQVPVSVLRYWILGRPAPRTDLDQLELNDDGTVRRMVQAGWYVNFKDYEAVAGGHLPQRVEVTGPDLSLTLLLNGWTLTS